MTEAGKAMLEEVAEVIRDALGDDSIAVTENSIAEDIPGWDSMAHINIIIAVEQRFCIRFTARDLVGLRRDGGTVGSLVELIALRKGG